MVRLKERQPQNLSKCQIVKIGLVYDPLCIIVKYNDPVQGKNMHHRINLKKYDKEDVDGERIRKYLKLNHLRYFNDDKISSRKLNRFISKLEQRVKQRNKVNMSSSFNKKNENSKVDLKEESRSKTEKDNFDEVKIENLEFSDDFDSISEKLESKQGEDAAEKMSIGNLDFTDNFDSIDESSKIKDKNDTLDDPNDDNEIGFNSINDQDSDDSALNQNKYPNIKEETKITKDDNNLPSNDFEQESLEDFDDFEASNNIDNNKKDSFDDFDDFNESKNSMIDDFDDFDDGFENSISKNKDKSIEESIDDDFSNGGFSNDEFDEL